MDEAQYWRESLERIVHKKEEARVQGCHSDILDLPEKVIGLWLSLDLAPAQDSTQLLHQLNKPVSAIGGLFVKLVSCLPESFTDILEAIHLV